MNEPHFLLLPEPPDPTRFSAGAPALFAAGHHIIRGSRPGQKFRCPRRPMLVATLFDESRFLFSRGRILHGNTLFIEPEHDEWSWDDGILARHGVYGNVADLVLVWAISEEPCLSRYERPKQTTPSQILRTLHREIQVVLDRWEGIQFDAGLVIRHTEDICHNLVSRLALHNLVSSLLCVKGWRRDMPVGVHERWRRLPKRDWSHTVVTCKGIVIDLCVRQFDPSAAVPTLYPMSSLGETWGTSTRNAPGDVSEGRPLSRATGCAERSAMS